MTQLTVLFLIKEDKVLLAMKKRGFGEGRWNGVGGKLEPGESIEQAVVRESQEEIRVTPTRFTKTARIIFHENHKGRLDILEVHVFLASAWEGKPSETEEMSPRWFQIDSIPYGEMWDDDPHWLPAVLAGKKLVCEFWLDKDDRLVQKSVKEVGRL